jgi:4-hydroxy-tetrahydrodipicolinate synthase
MKTLGETFKHIIVPLLTPFTKDGQEVDYGAVGKIVEHLIGREFCDTILVAGTTGEFNTLLFEERVELFRVVRDAVRKRVPLLAGTGAASTRETVRLTRKAEELGYDAAMVVAPYYCKPTQEGIYRHFQEVAESTKLPIMLYNIPIFTGVNMDPSTVARLAKIRNIRGIKDEAGINPTQMTEYAAVTPKGFTIYNGDDIMVLCGLAQGAAGVVSGGSHVIGDRMRKMIRLFLQGKNEEAREIHASLDPLFKSFAPRDGMNPIPGMKAAIEMIGVSAGPPRLPLVEASPEHKEAIRKNLVRLGVL